MKVFISWSGPVSQQVALALREWLPLIIQSVQPYVSAEDIDKGTRWSGNIAEELADARFGILCITKTNVAEPWINFEAGALSKTLDRTFVSPLLLDLRAADIDRRSPLLQFQSTLFKESDVWRLMETLQRATGQPIPRLESQFKMWWPKLRTEVDAALAQAETPPVAPAKSRLETMVEELLELSRDSKRHRSAWEAYTEESIVAPARHGSVAARMIQRALAVDSGTQFYVALITLAVDGTIDTAALEPVLAKQLAAVLSGDIRAWAVHRESPSRVRITWKTTERGDEAVAVRHLQECGYRVVNAASTRARNAIDPTIGDLEPPYQVSGTRLE